MKVQSRRHFLKAAVPGGVGLLALPTLLTARLRGSDAPGKKIQIAQIGCGRMGRSDLGNVMTEPLARVVAVCDLDSRRLAAGKKFVEDFYAEQGESGVRIKTYHDYREVLASPEIDAVIVTVPDHAHALIAIQAAIAGKHLYVQKPVTYSIAEAIGLRRAVEGRNVILQTGSQQRSERPWGSFRKASEAVRNGRIGQVQTIRIGLGLDRPSGKRPVPMSVPENLDYERWLGPAPEQPYLEGRVHPQDSPEGRPGWITAEDFGLGMITNWGAHHVDIAQWAIGQELGGPQTVEARAAFVQDDWMTVHSTYHVELGYPKGVKLVMDHQFEPGIRFEGDEGWIFCTRSGESEAVGDTPLDRAARRPLRASDALLLSPLAGNAHRWMPSRTHHGNWLESIAAHHPPIAPIQQSARSLEACAAAWIGMKLKRRLTWDAAAERFVGDEEANALRGRKARSPEYDFELALKKAGLV